MYALSSRSFFLMWFELQESLLPDMYRKILEGKRSRAGRFSENQLEAPLHEDCSPARHRVGRTWRCRNCDCSNDHDRVSSLDLSDLLWFFKYLIARPSSSARSGEYACFFSSIESLTLSFLDSCCRTWLLLFIGRWLRWTWHFQPYNCNWADPDPLGNE